MKRVIVAAALTLAACSKTPVVDTSATDLWEYHQLIQQGYTPAQAKVAVKAARSRIEDLQYDPRIAHDVDKKEAGLSEVRSDACKNDPALGYCH